MVLQTSPLPLGYHTIKNVLVIYQNQTGVSTRGPPECPEWAKKSVAENTLRRLKKQVIP